MLALKKIAVTGGIASGKSTVCRFFKELGAHVISADDVVHQLLIPQTDLGKKVIALLGQDVVVDEAFSRSAIARKVFNDPCLLENLEQLLHPEVQRLIEGQYYQVLQEKPTCQLFVAEIPLLFETGQHMFYDFTISVVASDKTCRERFKKNFYDIEEFDRRNKRLLSMEEKRKKADFTLTNNGSLTDLKNAVTALYNNLT